MSSIISHRLEQIQKACLIDFDSFSAIKLLIERRKIVARNMSVVIGIEFENLSDEFDYINNKIKDFLAL